VTRPRILCVDDEPRVLEGIRRLLHKSFDVSTAEGGAAALARLDAGESFEVVVSDMQMPKMNGATLLTEFRTRAPDTTRVLLTGHADIESAILAVNRGQIFRFLTKPCPPEELTAALEASVNQHRLITVEKVLLEQTLVGSVRALTEVLALVNPEVFGATMRQHARVRAVADRMGLADAWHVEVASMLGSVGLAVLPSDVATKLQAGAQLETSEQAMANQVPEVVERVLSHIPRLENVRALLKSYDVLRPQRAPDASAPIGARILLAVKDLAALETREADTARAIVALRSAARHSPDIIEAIAAECQVLAPEVQALGLDDLRSGMVLAADVLAKNGALLVAHGQVVSAQLIQRMRNFHVRVGVAEPILCEAHADSVRV
jgi:response regulator RpfG family c-di-GMP phosphodiesterase